MTEKIFKFTKSLFGGFNQTCEVKIVNKQQKAVIEVIKAEHTYSLKDDVVCWLANYYRDQYEKYYKKHEIKQASASIKEKIKKMKLEIEEMEFVAKILSRNDIELMK